VFKLYHNLASTCSQKVRWVFAEEQMPYESVSIDLMAGEHHEAWYVAINPDHVVPTLVHDTQVILESSLIIQYLDDFTPQPTLTPGSALERYRMRRWLRLVDNVVHPAAPTLTYAVGPRKLVLSQPKEVREAKLAAMPDPVQRELRRSVLEHGVHAPEFRGALRVYLDLLDAMQATLTQSRWLAGDQLSLAEASVLPYILRMHHLAMDPFIDARPAVSDWFRRLQDRPSFKTAVTDWLPEPVVQMLRANGLEVWPEVEAQSRGVR